MKSEQGGAGRAGFRNRYCHWSTADRCKKRQLVLSIYLAAVLTVSLPLYLLAIGKGTRIPVLREYLVEQYLVQFKQGMPGGNMKDAPKPVSPAPSHPY